MQSNGKNAGVDRPDGTEQSTDSIRSSPDAEIDQHNVKFSDDIELKLDDAAQVLIGLQLKAVYGEIVQQAIPEQFLKLLDELEQKEQER